LGQILGQHQSTKPYSPQRHSYLADFDSEELIYFLLSFSFSLPPSPTP
jgi:hypothetical protein